MNRQLVLVGAGHAHVEVVRQLGTMGSHVHGKVEFTLISPDSREGYSGMMPGVIAGHYLRHEAEINVAGLCERAGVRFIQTSLRSINVSNSELLTSDGLIHYDVASLNLGSAPAMPPIGSAQQAVHWPVKPFGAFLDRLESWLAGTDIQSVRNIAVIGAGAAGIEVLLALQHRLESQGVQPQFTLLTTASDILPSYPASVRSRVRHYLNARKVSLMCGHPVSHADRQGLHLSERPPVAVDAAFWATGPSPVLSLADSGLALDGQGFVLVDETFAALGADNVFAVGDCATHLHAGNSAWPKAGVVPVRQGPHLARNLLARLNHQPRSRFEYRPHALSLLSLGGRRAIGHKGDWLLHGSWVWPLKDLIDRRFMAKYA